MSLTTPDARAVVAAVDRLTTQVKRMADGASTPVTTADDGPARVITHWGPLSEQRFEEMRDNARQLTDWITERAQQTPATDEDAERTARRERLHNLLARADRGTLTPGETAALRDLVDAEAREADTMRAVAAGNKRHVQLLYTELQEAQRERDQQAAVLAEVLRHFTEHGHPGAPCVRTPWVRTDTVDRWRSVVQHDVERPWWQQLDTARAELEQAQAALERVRALATEPGETNHYIARERLLAALDGTDQPTTEV